MEPPVAAATTITGRAAASYAIGPITICMPSVGCFSDGLKHGMIGEQIPS